MTTPMENYLMPPPDEVSSPQFHYIGVTEVQVEIPGQVSNMGLDSYSIFVTSNLTEVLETKNDLNNQTQYVTIELNRNLTLQLRYVMRR